MNPPSIPPLLLFRSFLTVVSGFIAGQVLFFLAALAISYFFYPAYLNGLFLDPEEYAARMEAAPEEMLPSWGMFAGTLVLTGIVYWWLGFLIARWAPFAQFLHVLFVAMLIVVWFVQAYLEGDFPQKRAMDLLYLILLPIPLLLGGHLAQSSVSDRQEGMS